MTVASQPAPGFVKYPNHTVAIKPEQRPIRVTVNGTEIARTEQALAVTESKHHAVWYLPLTDVATEVLEPSDTQTYCPFKGTASYWHVKTDAGTVTDALWGYEQPFIECAELAGYVSFYADKVELCVGDDAQLAQAPGFKN